MRFEAANIAAAGVAATIWLLGFASATITSGALHIPAGDWTIWGLVGIIIATVGTLGRFTAGWRQTALIVIASAAATTVLVASLFAAQWVVLGGVFTGLAVLSLGLGWHSSGGAESATAS